MGYRERIGDELRPLLLVVPLAMCATTTLFDFAALLAGSTFFRELGYWNLAAALLAGALATAALPPGVRAFRLDLSGRQHRLIMPALGLLTAPTLNTIMLALLGLVWVARVGDGPGTGVAGFLVELLALAAGARVVWHRRELLSAEDSSGEFADLRPALANEPTVRLWVVPLPASMGPFGASSNPAGRPGSTHGAR